jgi:hypothetical protein
LGGGLFLLLINLWLLFLQAIKDGKFIEEDISKYQEDVYFFKLRIRITPSRSSFFHSVPMNETGKAAA